MDQDKLYKMLEKIKDAVTELEHCVSGEGDAPLAFIENQVTEIQQAIATKQNQEAEPVEGEEYQCACGRVHVVPEDEEVVECGCGLVSYWDEDAEMWEQVAQGMCGM